MGITSATVIMGFQWAGIPIEHHHFSSKHHHLWGSTVEFQMRLSATWHPLPTKKWLKAEDRRGNVAKHSLEGAKYLLFGQVHELEDGGSATIRIVDAETSIVKAVVSEIYEQKTYFRAAKALEKAIHALTKRFAIRLKRPTDGRVKV